MAAGLLQEISQDEHERARLLSRKKYETDLYSNLHTAERRGKMKGEQREHNKWQSVVADMKTEITKKDKENERLRMEIAELKAKK